ncbi:MAG: response regulator [Chryseolinea sp.]
MKRIFLLADDDIDDTELFREALEDIDRLIVFYCVSDGKQVLAILGKQEFEKPQIIFLDVNMPGMDGWDCLGELKKNELYKDIPVIMYSTSSHQREANIAIDLGALCFFTKPSDFVELKGILKVIVENLDGNLLQAVSHFMAIKFNRTVVPLDGI